jgi:hypothetical protein
MPAFTMVAEWRYDETGVGAVIAFGSQKWRGICADLEQAPMITSTRAGVKSAWPVRSAEASTEMRDASAAAMPLCRAEMCRRMKPASIARPPAPVISRACRAESRAACFSCLKPMSRYDAMLVSSQKTKSTYRSSLSTTPSIALRKSRSCPTRRPSRGSSRRYEPA